MKLSSGKAIVTGLLAVFLLSTTQCTKDDIKGVGSDLADEAKSEAKEEVDEAKDEAKSAATEKMGKMAEEQLNLAGKCYKKRLKKKPDLAGKVVVKFKVNARGKVSKVKIVENTTEDKKLAKCIRKKVKKWRLPNPKRKKKETITYPFVFSPDEE